MKHSKSTGIFGPVAHTSPGPHGWHGHLGAGGVQLPLYNTDCTQPPQQPVAPVEYGQTGLAPLGPRAWLRVSAKGECSLSQVDKHKLVVDLGVPYRDLRMLDPQVPIPYPSSVFIRERALVVNLESIRMLICKDQLYVLSVPSARLEAGATPSEDHFFVKDLILRLQAGQTRDDGSPLNRESLRLALDRYLPYELRALECALACAVRMLGRECTELERQAWGPLERLTQRVSRTDLEIVRSVKSQMNKLMGRVGNIRKGLEDILDDDQDMQDMYLGRRAEQEAAARMASLAAELATRLSSSGGPIGSPLDGIPLRVGSVDSAREEPLSPRAPSLDLEVRAAVNPHDIEGCEALLESYFMQVDFMMSGLMQLKERIDDTEDLINIELDHRRNELVALDLIISIGTACLTFLAVIAGFFGMNVSPLPLLHQGTFVYIVCTSIAFAAILFGCAVAYARWKRLLFLGSPHALSVTTFDKKLR